jgi:ribonuclease R
VLGVLRQGRGHGVVEAFDASRSPIVVPSSFLGDARPGDTVEVEMLRRERPDSPAEGRVVAVLGPPDEPGVDIEVVARTHGLSMAFPAEVLEEARLLPDAVPRAEAERRERFEDPPVVTIDGETARDFDDAISVMELPGGGFRLFVHIADVAYFVPEGRVLDLEARARGTSVYFPDHVLPMFPERLSNDLCSLRPGEDRLVQSVILDLDAQGEPKSVRFADGVIHSTARLTYTQVAAVLEGETVTPARNVLPMLRTADRLRERLEKRRERRGSIDFDFPEPVLLFDIEGVMTGITIAPRNKAHRMIEEFMLVANESVAAHLEKRDVPALYRVHERPDPLKVEALREFAASLGLLFRVDPSEIRPRDLQRLLQQAEGRPEFPILSQVVLRSMKQARYSAENVGHFGLAAPVYTHFTSPIRRYPDLVVHRILRATRTADAKKLDRGAEGLAPLAETCSRLERNAEAAEREVLLWRKIAFMKGREGEGFEGLVTGVTRFGLFVQLTESLVEGLLHVQNIGDERWTFDERRMELRGEHSGKRFRLGDKVRVIVQRVDVVLRRVDLALEGAAKGRRGTETARRRPRSFKPAATSRAPRAKGRSKAPAPRRSRAGKGGRRGRR